MLNIALDYDNTYTADPYLWEGFITMALNAGHNIFIVTYRDDRYDKNDELQFLEEDDVPVYYTRGAAKKWWMDQFAPDEHAKVDIWIDDRPEAILQNSGFNRKQLAEWRAEEKYDPNS